MKFFMSFLTLYIIFKTKISQLQFFNFLLARARKIHCASRSRLPFNFLRFALLRSNQKHCAPKRGTQVAKTEGKCPTLIIAQNYIERRNSFIMELHVSKTKIF